MGRVDPDDGRPDHGPRRRRRPAGPAPAGASPRSWCWSIRDEEGAGEAATQDRRRAACRRRAVPRSTPGTDVSFGRRATDWELKGVPVRVEVGPRDLADGEVTLVRRDTGEKVQVPVGEVAARVGPLLDTIQADMLAAATAFQHERTAEVATHRRGREAARPGFARLAWSAARDRRRVGAGRARRHRPLPAAARRHGAGDRGRARPRGHRRPRILSRTSVRRRRTTRRPRLR